MINLFKIWVLNWRFVQREIEAHKTMAREEERPKVFQMAQKDILDTMKDDMEKQANEIAEKKLGALLSVVDEQHVVKYDKSGRLIYIGETLADEARLGNLRAEAQQVLESEVWKIIYETPKSLAEKAMFVAGESIDDMKKGRAILYTLATQKRILGVFKSYAPKSTPKT